MAEPSGEHHLTLLGYIPLSTLVFCFDLPRCAAPLGKNHLKSASWSRSFPAIPQRPFSGNSSPPSCKVHKAGSHLSCAGLLYFQPVRMLWLPLERRGFHLPQLPGRSLRFG
jgi:hypothetical protein